LHALDALTEWLIGSRRYADATSAALAAVKVEPFRRPPMPLSSAPTSPKEIELRH
jgi:hypothetical protein